MNFIFLLLKLVGNMSVVDSEAVFRSRAKAVGLSEEVLNLLKDGEISNMGNLAFATSYVPGSSDDKPFTEFVAQVLKRDATLGEMAKIRRLFNEAYAATSAEMKTMVEQSDEAPLRRLAPAERAERFSEQQKRLRGINMQGQMEPGDSLVDAAVGIYESDRLTYIPWEKCVSREHEMMTSTKKDAALSFDSAGTLKLNKKDNISPCDVSSELQVKYCLARRALALEQGNVMSFENLEKWTEKLMSCRLSEPPHGYSRVSFKQLQLADAKLFVVLGERTRSGIKVSSSGRPCDNVFTDVMNCPEVQHLLQPLPQSSSTSKGADKGAGVGPPIKRTIEKFGGSGKGTGKKGKGGKAWKPSIPQELLSLGCVGVTNKGNPLCYDFQLGKCSNTVQSGRCQKGLHLCAVQGCHRDHPAKDCNRAQKKRE